MIFRSFLWRVWNSLLLLSTKCFLSLNKTSTLKSFLDFPDSSTSLSIEGIDTSIIGKSSVNTMELHKLSEIDFLQLITN